MARRFGIGVVAALGVLLSAVPAHATATPTFVAPITWGAGVFGYSPAIGDVTGDGRPDLLVTSGREGYPDVSLSVFPEQGDGSLGQPRTYALDAAYPAYSAYWGVATGDFDGDGNKDAAVATPTGVDVLYQRNAALQGPTLLPVGGGAADVAAADVNGDGRADVAAATYGGVLLFTDAASGWTQQTLATWQAELVAVGDVNGDGRPDVVDLAQRIVSGASHWYVDTFVRRSDGTFAVSSTAIDAGFASPDGLAVGDLSGDGLGDVAVSNDRATPDSKVEILDGTSSGAVTAGPEIGVSDGAAALAITDVDRDGRNDLVVAHDGQIGDGEGIGVLMNLGAGMLGTETLVNLPPAFVDRTALAAGDLNGDGRPDVVSATDADAFVLLRQTGFSDTTPPQTTTTAGPPQTTSLDYATFAFQSSEIGSTFDCSLDGAAWSACTSPLQLRSLSGGTHTFSVRARDSSGNVDATPATQSWTLTAAPAAPPFLQPWNYDPGPLSGNAAVGDVNGDGHLDVLWTTTSSPDSLGTGSTFTLFAFLQQANGALAAPTVVGTDAAGANTTNDRMDVAAADLNGDAKTDAAVTMSNGINVFLQSGGHLGAPTLVSGSAGAQYLKARDLNGDGHLDLVASFGSPTQKLAVYWGPTFASSTTLYSGAAFRNFAIGDVDGDGRPDVALSLEASSGVALLRQTSPGAYVQSTLATPSPPSAVTIGDLTGDGRADLLVGGVTGGDVVYRQATDGTLGAPLTYDDASSDGQAAVVDLNGDGRNDVVGGTIGAPGMVQGAGIEMQSAAGLLGDLTELRGPIVNDVTRSAVVGDVNGDGRPDVVAADREQWGLMIYYGQGADTTPPETTITSGPSSQTPSSSATFTFVSDDATASFQCLVSGRYMWSACTSPLTVSGVSPGSMNVEVRAVDPAGNVDPTPATWGWVVTSSTPGGPSYPAGTTPNAIARGDFNGDEHTDLVVADQTASAVSILNGNGDGSFQAPRAFATGASPSDVVRADLNGDGKPDVATANYAASGAGSVSVLLGNGDGTLRQATTYSAGDGTYGIAAADVNGDGIPDLVAADTTANEVTVFIGKGDGTFAAGINWPTGGTGNTWPYAVAVADVNGDGKADLVTANYESSTISVLRGAGDGTFGAPTQYATGRYPVALAVADMTNDGIPDVVTADHHGDTVSVLVGTSGGAFAAPRSFPVGDGTSVDVDYPAAVAVADLNRDGKRDVVAADYGTNRVSILSGNGDGTLAAPTWTTTDTAPADVVVGDVNGDGTADVVTANHDANTVTVLPNESTGGDTTPPDTTIVSGPPATTTATTASFSFTSTEAGSAFECSFDGRAYEACGTPRAYSGLAVGSHTFAVRAVDPAGNVDPSPAQRSWQVTTGTSANLLPNGSFDNGLTGWSSYQGTLSLASDGNAGANAAKVTLNAGASDWFSIYPSDRVVRSTTAGQSYVATGWVRSDTPGSEVCLYLREWSSSTTIVGSTKSCATTTGAWQQFPAVAYTTAQSGGSLEFFVGQTNPQPGAGFEVDGLSVTAGSADTTPPDTTISSGPPASTSNTSATFAFTSSEANSTFQCSLDGAAYTACTSPKTYSGLAVGSHTFAVRAIDAAGNVDPSPAQQSWQVTSSSAGGTNLLPNGSFDNGLTGWSSYQGTLSLASDGNAGANAVKVTLNAGASDWFSIYPSDRVVRNTTAGQSYNATGWVRSDTPGASVCLYLREWSSSTTIVGSNKSCVTTATTWQQFPTASYTTTQSGGSLEFYVGQTNPQPGVSFEVDGLSVTAGGADTTPPDTTITSGPSASTTDTSATFAFTSSEANSTFQCSLDGAAYTACTSPKSYGGLAVGSHTFAVRAVDAAGNVDASPAQRSWQVTSSSAGGTNLLPNGSFDNGLTGWSSYQGTLSLASDGNAGANAAKVTLNAGASDWFSIYPSDRVVRNTAAGQSYNATGWVRSDTPGTSVCVYLREWSSGGTIVGSNKSCVTTTTTWQQFPTAAYTTSQSGGSLEFYVGQTNPQVGASFEVDGLTVTAGSASTTPPPPKNLLPNGDFESGLTGWSSYQGTLALASDGNVGANAASVALNSGAVDWFSLYPTSRVVGSTTSGQAYGGTGWVRSDTPGTTVCLYLREWSSGGTIVSSAKSCVTTTTAWQQFPTASYTTTQSGGSLEFYVGETNPQPGDKFEVDGLSVTAG